MAALARSSSTSSTQRSWLYAGGLIVFLALVIAWSRSRGSSSSSASSSTAALSGSLTERGKAVASRLLVVEADCRITWASTSAPSDLVSRAYLTDFFAPAIAAARSSGATVTDAIAASVCRLLVPQCVWPPSQLGDLDLDLAAAGQLEGQASVVKWAAVSSLPSVQLYMIVRSIAKAS